MKKYLRGMKGYFYLLTGVFNITIIFVRFQFIARSKMKSERSSLPASPSSSGKARARASPAPSSAGSTWGRWGWSGRCRCSRAGHGCQARERPRISPRGWQPPASYRSMGMW